MKPKPGILDALQDVLTKELTGINQYFIHSKMCTNWGYARLAKFQWDESMDEMRHADKIIDRMLLLEGAPNMTRYDKVVEALGGHGEHVTDPADIVPALERAFASGKPALVNVEMRKDVDGMKGSTYV